MFVQRKNRNLFEAALTTLALIHHQTVYNMRMGDRNAVVGLLTAIFQSSLMVLAFYIMYYVMGIRGSLVRGDFMVFIMSGIFMFMTHIQAVGAVSGSGALTSNMIKHAPLNTAVLISGAAMATLYKQMLSCIVIMWLYHAVITPIEIENWLGCLSMLLLAWLSGCGVGMVFLAMRPWWPKAAGILTMVYQRINMVASGKMFLANTIPSFMLPWFYWNPLFHIIDQARGFAFINYSPQRTSVEYPLWVTVAVIMIGLMAEFVTRNRVSLSWSMGK
ncbi:MAG: ABC transporter [Paracoccus sp. (in: a-proteobacteria)]|uniref:ABC transporter permease n=1 Tax=Paracoccus sp. TaxID=267 RepID=UPI0026DF39F6|nr:ABC transporter [Paracoccus sp. (in: a-proteobacteria)]MDO5612446.1 ABC transporter [Paracoccus sp. (in: a-proteobacteria)]